MLDGNRWDPSIQLICAHRSISHQMDAHSPMGADRPPVVHVIDELTGATDPVCKLSGAADDANRLRQGFLDRRNRQAAMLGQRPLKMVIHDFADMLLIENGQAPLTKVAAMKTTTEPSEIGQRLRQMRVANGWNQQELANRTVLGNGRTASQSAIAAIETGQVQEPRPAMITALSKALGISPSWLKVGKAEPEIMAFPPAPPGAQEAVGGFLREPFPHVPIYASAEAGRGMVINADDVVEYLAPPSWLATHRDVYGLYVVGSSMKPAIHQGHMAFVTPKKPPVPGDLVILLAHELTGETRAIIKELKGETARVWRVLQYNPQKEIELEKKEWQLCHRVDFIRR